MCPTIRSRLSFATTFVEAAFSLFSRRRQCSGAGLGDSLDDAVLLAALKLADLGYTEGRSNSKGRHDDTEFRKSARSHEEIGNLGRKKR